jgi:DDE superfamily endonuclease
MIRMTRVPEEVTRLLAPLKPYFSYRHYLVFCWLLVAHLVCFGKATVQGLARYTPRHVAAWHLRRLLAAGRWPWARVLEWLVSETLAAFPPPRDGVLYLVVDSTLKGKRSKKNPLAKKGRLNEYAPYTFGLHVVILIAQWDVYRVPLAFRLVKPKGSKGYQSENALFREMLQEVILPAWCKTVVVVADAAYPSRANLQAIQARHWFFVIAFPRTWKLTNGQHLRDVVTHLPIHHYRKVCLPLLVPSARRRVFWTFAKRAQLRQVGDVTVVLSRRRRNDSPKQTKLLVTNLPQATAHTTVACYLRRWPVAVSREGSITQSVQVRPRLTDSGLVAREAPGRESQPVKPSDNPLGRERAQRSRLQRAVNADVASLHATPVAELVYYGRRQQGPGERGLPRRSSPAGYQR